MAPTILIHDTPHNNPNPIPTKILPPPLNSYTDWQHLLHTPIFNSAEDDGALSFIPSHRHHHRCCATIPPPTHAGWPHRLVLSFLYSHFWGCWRHCHHLFLPWTPLSTLTPCVKLSHMFFFFFFFFGQFYIHFVLYLGTIQYNTYMIHWAISMREKIYSTKIIKIWKWE